MKAQTFTALREDKLRQNNLKKCIFDSVRKNKEEEKTAKALHELNEVEIPRRMAAQQTIDEVSQMGAQKHQAWAVRVVSKNLQKGIFQYFETWRRQCETYQRVLNDKIKLRIINSYNGKLRRAFTQWIAFKGKKMISQQSEIYQSYQEEISDQNNQVIESQNMLKEKQEKQKTQSGKQMKKIMVGAFQRQLKEKFEVWRRNQHVKLTKQNKTQKLIDIMDKQLKRMAFKKYLAKYHEKIRDIQNEDKINVFLRRSTFRLLQRSFYGVLEFSGAHLSAKSRLRRVIRNLDQNVKQSTFKKWIVYRHEKQQEGLSASQSATVAQIKDLLDEAGHLQDQVENLSQQNKKTNHTLKQQAKRVIQNSFLRCHELSQRYYFDQWKAKAAKQRKLELAFKKAIMHWQRQGQDYALKLWMRWQAEKKQTVLEMAIQEEEQSASEIQSSTFKAQTQFRNERDQCVIDLNRLKKDESEFSQKHANCISAIVKRRDAHFYQPKIQYIVQHWREYTASRKRSYLLFEKCLTKSLWESAFTEIKLAARLNHKSSQKAKGQEKTINIIYKLKVKSAIRKWQSSIHSMVTAKQYQFEKEIQKTSHKFELVRDAMQIKLVDGQFKNRQLSTLFECYHELKAYSQWQKAAKQKKQELQQNVQRRQQQVAVVKWQKRLQATQRLRQKCLKIKQKLYQLDSKSVFNGWKEICTREKRLCECVRNLAQKSDHIDLQGAMELLKSKYFLNKSHEQRSKNLAKDALLSLLQGQNMRLKMQALKRFQFSTDQVNKATKHKRSILIKYLTQSVRSYLRVWQEKAQSLAVVEYNNDEGPIKIETHKLHKELQLLKTVLRDEGHRDLDIAFVLNQGKDRHTQLIEKVVSRMYCFNNDLYLLPQCLDEWKRWLKQRKAHRRAIQLLINRCDYNRSGLDLAFRKWKQMKAQTIIGIQKLALAVINGGQERTKQRALSRLLTQHHNATKSEYQQVLTFNLDKINELKNKINQLELSNHGIAEQNEELREGALDGIDMAQGIEELSNEREKLSIDLADKAIIIRKLLEDNNNLSIRLSNAQDEAEKLIRLSQLKISNNRSHTPNKYNS